MFGEELAALQRSKDIAQSDVACWRANSKPPPGPSRARINPAVIISEKSRRTTTGLVLALSATSSERRTLPGFAASAVSK
jgi:mRNA-degrading endonuclease toxin of MazEF toxin-antitoxin module